MREAIFTHPSDVKSRWIKWRPSFKALWVLIIRAATCFIQLLRILKQSHWLFLLDDVTFFWPVFEFFEEHPETGVVDVLIGCIGSSTVRIHWCCALIACVLHPVAAELLLLLLLKEQVILMVVRETAVSGDLLLLLEETLVAACVQDHHVYLWIISNFNWTQIITIWNKIIIKKTRRSYNRKMDIQDLSASLRNLQHHGVCFNPEER